jgi:hypothetical protein
MKPDRLDNLGGKVGRQPACALLLMVRIDSPVGNVFAEIVEQVPHIVEQAGRDQAVGLSVLSRKVGALERMFLLRDTLDIVLVSTTSTAVDDDRYHGLRCQKRLTHGLQCSRFPGKR